MSAIFRDAIRKYGLKNQVIQAIQELSELQKVLTKIILDDRPEIMPADLEEQLIDELADVEIMTAQMRIGYGVENKIAGRIVTKLERLSARMRTKETMPGMGV